MNRKFIFFLIVSSLTVIFSSCQEEEKEPYIIFKNADGDIILSDAWNVILDTTELLYIESGFPEDGYMFYERQIDDGPVRDLIYEQSEDVKILFAGIDQNLHLENAVISTTFDSELMNDSSLVKITVRDRSEMAKTFTYIVRKREESR